MAALSSMGSRRVPGAMPRTVERHFTVPSLLEERTATLRMEGGTLEGFQSRLDLGDNPGSPLAEGGTIGGSLNRGSYKTSNSVYGEEYMSAGRSGSGSCMGHTACQSGNENQSTVTIGRPITGRDAIDLPPSQYPAPTSFPAFPNSPTKALSSQTSIPASSTCRAEGTDTSTNKASKRYAQPKASAWETALEQTIDGLAPPTKCNGYGQALSNRAKLAQPAMRGAAAAEPASRGAYRVTAIMDAGRNPGASMEHAAYEEQQPRREDATYHGSNTGYVSGYSRNQSSRCIVPSSADARSQPAVTIEDVHPTIVRGIRVRDPVEYAAMVNPDAYATTYKQTIDAAAQAVTRVQH